MEESEDLTEAIDDFDVEGLMKIVDLTISNGQMLTDD